MLHLGRRRRDAACLRLGQLCKRVLQILQPEERVLVSGHVLGFGIGLDQLLQIIREQGQLIGRVGLALLRRGHEGLRIGQHGLKLLHLPGQHG